jgi:hypothetical protein
MTLTDTKLWQMDSEASYAKLTIQPIVTSNGTIYHVHGELHILPYPNPIGRGGGYWLPYDMQTLKEVEKFKVLWQEEINRWKPHGLVKNECVELPTKTIATQTRLL